MNSVKCWFDQMILCTVLQCKEPDEKKLNKMPRDNNSPFAPWRGGTQIKILFWGRAVLHQTSKTSEQMDRPALACPHSCASAASEEQGWAPSCQMHLHTHQCLSTTSPRILLLYGLKTSSQIHQASPITSSGGRQEGRGAWGPGSHPSICCDAALPGRFFLGTSFGQIKAWGPFLIMICWGSVAFSELGWNIWSKPSRKEGDRGISTLECTAFWGTQWKV